MSWFESISGFFVSAYQKVRAAFNYVLNHVSGAREMVDQITEIGTSGAVPVPDLKAAIKKVGGTASPEEVLNYAKLADTAYLTQSEVADNPLIEGLRKDGATVRFVKDPVRPDEQERTRAIVVTQANGDVIVALRGTHLTQGGIDLRDAAINAVCMPTSYPGIKGAKVHAGFLTYYQTIADDIRDDVRKALKAGHTVTFTGHSQGAGLAQIAAADPEHPAGKIRIVTFGSPRVGNKAFAEYLQKRCPDHLRIVHARDPIAGVVPCTGFVHGTPSVTIKDGKLFVSSPNDNGTITSTLSAAAVGCISPEYFNAAHGLDNYEHALRQHAGEKKDRKQDKVRVPKLPARYVVQEAEDPSVMPAWLAPPEKPTPGVTP